MPCLYKRRTLARACVLCLLAHGMGCLPPLSSRTPWPGSICAAPGPGSPASIRQRILAAALLVHAGKQPGGASHQVMGFVIELQSARPPGPVHTEDGRVVSTKGEKVIVEKTGDDWDGGSRGTVYTKGKRGKGFY